MALLVFDIETRIDKQLLNQVFFAEAGLDDQTAYERFRSEARGRGNDFLPTTLHRPITIALGAVSDDYALTAVTSLDAAGNEEGLVREFWRQVEDFRGTLVSFNGRTFDLPVLELAALRYGLTLPRYFDENPADSLRVRHAGRHCDLYDLLCNYGAAGIRGGLDLLLKVIGLPGKGALDGSRVQDYYETGRLDEIRRYCRRDVIQTYFLLLRVELMRGRLDDARYRAAAAASAPFMAELDAPSAAER